MNSQEREKPARTLLATTKSYKCSHAKTTAKHVVRESVSTATDKDAPYQPIIVETTGRSRLTQG
jgi:hypothetical protein